MSGLMLAATSAAAVGLSPAESRDGSVGDENRGPFTADGIISVDRASFILARPLKS